MVLKYQYIVNECNGCWEYQSPHALRGGYGPYKKFYEDAFGPVPDGLHLDHLCRNRRCVNPSHLEPVTRLENFLRGDHFTAVVIRTGVCVNGHALEGSNVKVTSQGKRRCVQCHNDRMARYRVEGRLKWERGGVLRK